MSILIKGMEMPSGCLSCDFCNPFVDEPYCRRLMRRTPKVTRLEDCPLVPVPPHGRLVDADELDTEILQAGFSYALTRRNLRYTPGDVRQKIANAPTIIEAEEGE